MKLLGMLAICILLINITSAEVETLGDFKQNTCVDLVQTCSNCTYMNITSVKDPNSRTVLLQKEMTKDGTEYNYSFCSTGIAGKYIVNGLGDVDGLDTVWAYDFNIVGIGSSGNKGITETSFLIFIALIIAFAVYWKVSRFLGSMIVMILGFGLLFTVSENGWIAWTIIGSGFLSVIYSLLSPSKKRRY